MTATEELRRLLDERGVEWEDSSPVPSTNQWKTSYISFTGEEVTLSCYDDPKWIMGTLVFHTPEQAIEATLGRGECRMDMLNTGDCAGYECSEHIMHCNGCGHEFGHVLYNEDGDVWMSTPPNYCPNCGRKVRA